MHRLNFPLRTPPKPSGAETGRGAKCQSLQGLGTYTCRDGEEGTGGKEPPPNLHISHLRKLGWHMDCSMDGNLILQLKNTRNIKKKTTPTDKQNKTKSDNRKRNRATHMLGSAGKECQSINWHISDDLSKTISIKNEHTIKTSTWETEAGRSWVWWHPGYIVRPYLKRICIELI